MSDVKWIKITTDIFDDEKILMIESLPSADSIIVIWFKLLTFAGKQNNDGVFIMNNRIAYTEEMLASIFRRDLNTVKLALNTFRNFGMIEIVDDVITIPNWNKHQTLDAYEQKKERDRLYQAERRRKQKLLIEKSSDKSSDSQTSQSSDVAKNRSIKEDKEEEKEIDKDIYINIVAFLNEKAGTKFKPGTKKTRTLIHERISEGFTFEDFQTVIEKKVADWKGTEWEQYLRPETLFGTKFEAYLNAKTVKKQKFQQHVNTGVPEGSQDDLDDVF